MAKKKTTKKKAVSRRSTAGKQIKGLFDITKIGGMAGAAFAYPQLDKVQFIAGLDPKIKAAGLIVLGEYLQKNQIFFVHK
jgi:hypothetical protein